MSEDEPVAMERFTTIFRGEECDVEITILEVGPPPILTVEFHSGNKINAAPSLEEVQELVKLAYERSKRRMQ